MTITLNEGNLSNLRAYSEVGEMLLATFRDAGHSAMLEAHIDDECATMILRVNAMPPVVIAVLDERKIRHEIVDFQDDAKRTIATYKVTLFQHDLWVVAVVWHDTTVNANKAAAALGSAP